MCGRSITAHAAAFERAIRLGKISCQFERSYNVAPTLSVPVVRPLRYVCSLYQEAGSRG